jgi:alpha-ketoglutarate-dependent taurine dioxygenase
VTPERTDDGGMIPGLLAMDGAAVLETDGEFSDEALLDRIRALLGSSLRALRQPIKVRAGSGPHPQLDWSTRIVHIDNAQRHSLHADGYGRYGAAYPDYVFLLCERAAEVGGASFVVDFVRLVDDLRSDPSNRELTEFLWHEPVEQCSPEGVLWRAPVARVSSGGRRSVICNDKQKITDATADQERLLGDWKRVVAQAEETAPRFLLRRGDLLCLDNYRVAHGRDPYEGDERLLHRVWTWTEAAFGVPDPDATDVAGAARDLAGAQPQPA